MYTMSFEITAFLLSLLCFVYCLVSKRRQYIPPKGFLNKLSNQHFLFLAMLLSNIFSSISSVVGVYLTDVPGQDVVVWQYVFHALYFVFHTTLSMAFGLYIMSVTGTTFKRHKWLYVLFSLPYIVAELLVLTNHWTGWAFYMDADRIYHRGNLMLLLYGLAGFYVVMGFVFFFKNMKAVNRVDRIAVGFFILIATFGIVLQAVRSDLLVELFCEALACLVIMMVLEDKAGHIDPVTGLYNRAAFLDENRRLLANKEEYVVVLIKITEIDRFTKRFSTRAADALLLKVSAFLNEASRLDSVYRLTRENFAVVFKEGNLNRAEDFAQAVLGRFEQQWRIDKIEIVLETVATILHVPEHIGTFSELEDLISLNYQKDKAGSYLVPQEEIAALAKSRAYEEMIKYALAHNGFHLRYQPIWSVREGRTVSAEALLRADEGPLAELSPEIYIPIAEKSGLIKDIGLFVFESACRFLCDERVKEGPIQFIELNLSTYQFLYGDLVERFEEIRQRYGVPARQLNLEITETAGALGRKEVVDALERFRNLGYTLSLDDFGTGYSNFVRMIKLQFENIKIDKSILWDLAKDEAGVSILRNLMLFIKNQGSSIVQEGVETKEQLELVKQCGCDYVQGFYFASALTEEKLFEYLDSEEKQPKR